MRSRTTPVSSPEAASLRRETRRDIYETFGNAQDNLHLPMWLFSRILEDRVPHTCHTSHYNMVTRHVPLLSPLFVSVTETFRHFPITSGSGRSIGGKNGKKKQKFDKLSKIEVLGFSPILRFREK